MGRLSGYMGGVEWRPKGQRTPNKQSNQREQAIARDKKKSCLFLLFDVCTRSGFSVDDAQRARGGSASDGIRLSALKITKLACLLLGKTCLPVTKSDRGRRLGART